MLGDRSLNKFPNYSVSEDFGFHKFTCMKWCENVPVIGKVRSHLQKLEPEL
jgi:hypothetical protein